MITQESIEFLNCEQCGVYSDAVCAYCLRCPSCEDVDNCLSYYQLESKEDV